MNIDHQQKQPVSINIIFLIIFLLIILGLINS